MKKKTWIIIAITVVAIIVAGVVAFFTYDAMQEVKLRQEAAKIGKLDITEENIDMKIKTTGKYAVIEQTMKDYMNEYSIKCKEVIGMMKDEKLAKILTAENYKNDGPEFTNSREYIATSKEQFNEKINTLIDMTSEEKMKEAIEGKNLEAEDIELYYELMLGEEKTLDLEETVETLQESAKSINNIYDVQEKVLNLLTTNKGKWEVNDDGEIEFSTQSLVDQYNNLISSL